MSKERTTHFELNETHYCLASLIGFPEIKPGDNLAELIFTYMKESLGDFQEGDIIIIASKIVSKAEGRFVNLANIQITPKAIELSRLTGKPPAVCQVILDNASKVKVVGNGTILGRTSLGLTLTSAGIDKLDKNRVTLLPSNPDSSARTIRESLEKIVGKPVAVIIVDSDGLAQWEGAIAIPIGLSGIKPIRETRTIDPISGKEKIQKENIAFMLANATAILLGQRGKNVPVVVVRGFQYQRDATATIHDAIITSVEKQ